MQNAAETTHLFSATHCIAIGVIAAVCILAAILYRKSVKKQNVLNRSFVSRRHPAAIVIGSVLFISDIIYYIVGAAQGWLTVYHLPLHLCTMAIYIVFIHSLFPADWIGQVLYALCLPGAWCALFFPDWIDYPILSYTAIRCYSVHGLIVVYVIMQTAAGIIVPRLSAIWKPILFLAVVSPPILYLNHLWNANYLFLSQPSPDSPLVFLGNLAGGSHALYLLYFGILTILGMTVMYLPFTLYRLVRKKQHSFS